MGIQLYRNNRSTSWVKDSKFNIKPVLTEDKIGQQNVRAGYTYDIWGSGPADYCTANFFTDAPDLQMATITSTQ